MSHERRTMETGLDDGRLGDVLSDVEAYYSARVAKHGATPLGVDWSCWATQNLRFVQLLKLCDFSAPFALNDIGCGYGALAAHLAMRHADAEIDYLGVDLSQAMIRRALLPQLCPPSLLALALATCTLGAFLPMIAVRLLWLVWRDGITLREAGNDTAR